MSVPSPNFISDQPPHRRTARIICGCCLLLIVALAARAELSEKIRLEITAAFPQFSPQPAKHLSPAGVYVPAPLSDDPLELLPDYHVRENRVPDKDPDLWLNRRAKDHKAMIEYYASMTNLEWALNWWHIPLPFGYSITPSAQTRANTAHFERKIVKDYKNLSALITTVAAIDSIESKKLLRDLDLTGHPGN